MDLFDAAVVGTGGIGSAALFHLARRGLRVIGIDQFSIAHDRGSSHGQSRIIRQAYFEHPDYVPLLHRAYELWSELESSSEVPLFDPVGLLEIGPPDGILIQGIEASAHQHNLQIERLTASESQRRFPTCGIPDGMIAIYEPTAGMLYVEACVAAHMDAAQSHGAQLLTNTRVDRIELDRTPILIHTATATIRSERLIVCGGAWANQLGVPCSLRVLRKHLHWFRTSDDRWQAKQLCPTFFYQLPEGYFYGFPAIDGQGVKVAEHSGGQAVEDPSSVDRSPCQEDDQRIRAFVDSHLQNLPLRRSRHEVCMYTLSPDEHFLVDLHPQNPRVAFAAGLSGHGFKFAPVLGEALCELVTRGESRHPIGFLSSERLQR